MTKKSNEIKKHTSTIRLCLPSPIWRWTFDSFLTHSIHLKQNLWSTQIPVLIMIFRLNMTTVYLFSFLWPKCDGRLTPTWPQRSCLSADYSMPIPNVMVRLCCSIIWISILRRSHTFNIKCILLEYVIVCEQGIHQCIVYKS